MTVYQRNVSLIQRNCILSVSYKFSGRYFIYEKNDLTWVRTQKKPESHLVLTQNLVLYIYSDSGDIFTRILVWKSLNLNQLYTEKTVSLNQRNISLIWRNFLIIIYFFELKKFMYTQSHSTYEMWFTEIFSLI